MLGTTMSQPIMSWRESCLVSRLTWRFLSVDIGHRPDCHIAKKPAWILNNLGFHAGFFWHARQDSNLRHSD